MGSNGEKNVSSPKTEKYFDKIRFFPVKPSFPDFRQYGIGMGGPQGGQNR